MWRFVDRAWDEAWMCDWVSSVKCQRFWVHVAVKTIRDVMETVT